MATHSSILAGIIPWTEEHSPQCRKESETRSLIHTLVPMHWLFPGAGDGTAVAPRSALVPGVGPATCLGPEKSLPDG